MGAEVQHRVRGVVLAQPAVEGAEGVRRREAALEQQPHRVALVAHRRLDADEHVAEALAEDPDRTPVAELAPGRGAPLGLDLLEPLLAPHVVVGGDARVHVGRRAVLLGVAVDDALAQRVDARRQLDRVALLLHRAQRVVERLEDAEERGGAGVAGVRRKVEQHAGDLALGALAAPQVDHARDARGKRVGALAAHLHVVRAVGLVERAAARAAGAARVAGVGTAAEHHRTRRAVELGEGDHHRRLDRQQPSFGAAPLLQRLELDRRHRQVRHVELRQRLLGGVGVVVGRTADEREAGERDERVDHRLAVAQEEALHGRARVEAAGEGGDHAQPARLERSDHAVVVRAVAGEQVRAHDEHADRAALAARGHARQRGDAVGEAPVDARVVDADLGVLDRKLGLGEAMQRSSRPARVAVDEVVHEVRHVLLGAREPVLQGEEIGAHVLCRAGNEAQQLRHATQHRHLTRAGTRRRRAVLAAAGLAAQLLQHGHQRARGRRHVEPAHARELGDLAGAHRADHRVAMVAARLQRRQHRQEVLLHEQHRDNHDVGVRDVVAAALERAGLVAPLGGGVHRQPQPRQQLRKAALGARRGADDVAVHRHQHDAGIDQGGRCAGLSAD